MLARRRFKAKRTQTGKAAGASPPWFAGPARSRPGSVTNEIVHHMDWLPTFLAAAGVPDIKEQLKRGGVQAIGREYKVHLDGYNILPLLTGETDKSPREEIFYFSDTGDLTALRRGDWKVIFLEQERKETLRAWAEPWTVLRAPMIFNLRRDVYERAYFTSNSYYDWMLDRVFFFGAAQDYVATDVGVVQGVPAPAKSRELRHRSGDGEVGDERRGELAGPGHHCPVS